MPVSFQPDVNMKLDNWPKFIFACLACICMTILMVVEVVNSDVGVPFLTAIAGYILGNGVRAVRNEKEQALFYGERRQNGGGTWETQ